MSVIAFAKGQTNREGMVFDPQQSSLPNGTPKQLYELYYNTTINPTSNNPIDPVERRVNPNNITKNLYNADPDAKTSSQEVAVSAAKYYQDSLKNDVDKQKTLLDDTNAHMQYTMLAMTIWVPLGIFAGYYLMTRGSTTS